MDSRLLQAWRDEINPQRLGNAAVCEVFGLVDIE